MTLTEEQKEIINEALKGTNILIDACWGSGKTTTIHEIYNRLHETKKVLYLTYNARLKTEARNRIKSKEHNIHNYDAYAFTIFANNKVSMHKNSGGFSEELAKDEYINLIPENTVDVLLIDEYQDINSSHAKILQKIADNNPNIQIIAVGDCDQKITNNTTLNAIEFMERFLGKFKKMRLSVSFRLSPELCEIQGNIFNKELTGLNEELEVKYLEIPEIVTYIKDNKIQAKNLMIIGNTYGQRSTLQNSLEYLLPDKFNKNTLYSDIRADDSSEKYAMDDSKLKKSCLCVTFDKCKGLERDVVVICDLTYSYWQVRARRNAPYFLLKNLFGVAVTRAKKTLIFVKGIEDIIDTQILKESYDQQYVDFKQVNVTDLFAYKCIEDIDNCYKQLNITPINTKEDVIFIPKNDALIDLSFVVGSYIEPLYFKNYNVNEVIRDYNQCHPDYKIDTTYLFSLKDKLLALASAQTRQNRYRKAKLEIDVETEQKIIDRFNTEFTRDYRNIQFRYEKNLSKSATTLIARIDALKDNIVYEFKFVNDLDKSHFLQLATYLLLSHKEKGVLWNIQNNTKYEVTLKDSYLFEQAIERLCMSKFLAWETNSSDLECKQYISLLEKPADTSNICFVDTETTIDGHIYSLGYVITDHKLNILKEDYFVNLKYDESDCIFGYNTYLDFENIKRIELSKIIELFKNDLEKYAIKNILAYNASFDYDVLTSAGLKNNFTWRDMMQPLRSKKYNPYLPLRANYDKDGLKLRSGYKVEDMYRYVINENYDEKHNALQDTRDEFEIYKKVRLKIKDCPKVGA